MSFFLLSHVMFQKDVPIYGPVSVLERFLKQKKEKLMVAYAPLTFEGVYTSTGKVKQKYQKKFNSMITKYLYDIYFAYNFLSSNNVSKTDVVIAVDPLNCISAVILKYFKKFPLIYYTADYSDKRFSNPLLNKIYHKLDLFCLSHSDQNWCVSERIVVKRRKQDKSAKVAFVPNTPYLPTEKSSTQSEKLKNSLLYVGAMDNHMNVELLLKSIKSYRKKNPKACLTLIGGGQLEDTLKKSIISEKMDKYVKYLGPQENKVVVENIKKHGIGLALYSGGKLWNKYGDSMKIREYQYFGLPVVTTEVPSNATEVKNSACGVVLNSKSITTSKITQAIEKIQKNYKDYSVKTHELMNKRQKETILSELLKPFLGFK